MNFNALTLVTEPHFFWLFICSGAYIGFCLFFTILKNKLALNQYLPFEINLPSGYWEYIIASTVLSFFVLCFAGLPTLIYHGESSYGLFALASITLPFAGILFFKRQKLYCSHFGFLSPLELYGSYFQSDFLRWIVLTIALFLSFVCFGLLLIGAGTFIHIILEGHISIHYGMAVFCIFILLHSWSSQYRTFLSLAWVQFFLFLVGLFCLSMYMLFMTGGIDGFGDGLRDLTIKGHAFSQDISPVAHASHLLEALPGPSDNFFMFTFLVGLMGLHTSPLFSLLAISTKNPNAIAPGLVWWSGGLIGGLILFVSICIGLGVFGKDGVHVIGGELGAQVNTDLSVFPGSDTLQSFIFIPQLIKHVQSYSTFLFGMIVLGAMTVLHMSAVLLIKLTSILIELELRRTLSSPSRHTLVSKNALVSNKIKRAHLAQVFSAFLSFATLYLMIYSPSSFLLSASLGIAFSFQLIPALIGVCYVPWLTRRAILTGLIAGLLVVLLTDKTNGVIANLFETPMAFGPHPFSIYSAVWGGIVNMMFVVFISAFTQSRNDLERQEEFHRLIDHDLTSHASLSLSAYPPHSNFLGLLAWGVLFIWFFFAIGPGRSLQTIFIEANFFESALLSYWVWLIFWWAFGVFMLWLLAYPLLLSRFPKRASY